VLLLVLLVLVLRLVVVMVVGLLLLLLLQLVLGVKLLLLQQRLKVREGSMLGKRRWAANCRRRWRRQACCCRSGQGRLLRC
jgi:hypothetical protein